MAEEKRAAEVARLELESHSLEAQLRRVRHDAGQLELVRVAHMDEIAALKERVATMSEDLAKMDSSYTCGRPNLCSPYLVKEWI